MLAAEAGAKLHIAHVSTKGSVEIIKKAKEAGVRITAETCPQYFSLTEEEILKQGAPARVNPPLRTAYDIEAIIGGLVDGTIDAIATDHAPHTLEEKALTLTEAPSGMIGLETSLALTLTRLYHTKKLGLERIIELMATNPARILGIDAGTLKVGGIADVVLFDLNEKWTVKPSEFKSKARNTPFGGVELKGRVKYTISCGEVVFAD
jgi:dihydroorotase